MSAATEVIEYGQVSDFTLLNETVHATPVVLVNSLSFSAQREETRRQNRNGTTKRVKYTDPIMELAYDTDIAEFSGIADAHPGTLVNSLANYASSVMGFDPTVGIKVLVDPERGYEKDSETVTQSFTVRHFPHVVNS